MWDGLAALQVSGSQSQLFGLFSPSSSDFTPPPQISRLLLRFSLILLRFLSSSLSDFSPQWGVNEESSSSDFSPPSHISLLFLRFLASSSHFSPHSQISLLLLRYFLVFTSSRATLVPLENALEILHVDPISLPSAWLGKLLFLGHTDSVQLQLQGPRRKERVNKLFPEKDWTPKNIASSHQVLQAFVRCRI